MILVFYLLLWVIAFVCLLNALDKQEQLNQSIFAILSVVLWAIVSLSSFNVVIGTTSTYDLAMVGIGLGFLIISFLNAFVVLVYGNIENYFSLKGV